MKYLIILTILFSREAIAQAWSPAKTRDPIEAYAEFHKLDSKRIIYRWDVDLTDGSQNVVLLDTKATATELDEEIKETKGNLNENVRNFTVYIPNSNGSGYTESRGLDEGDGMGIGPGAGMEVDVTQCYVGYITQLKRRGLVTIESDQASGKAPSEARIYAYTIEGDHLKVTDLARYDQSKGNNAIYDQYLSKENRTPVKLEQITLP